MKAQQQSPKGHWSLFILSVYTGKRNANYQTNSGTARTRRRQRLDRASSGRWKFQAILFVGWLEIKLRKGHLLVSFCNEIKPSIYLLCVSVCACACHGVRVWGSEDNW